MEQFARLIFLDYNKNLELQYRGRIRELKDLKPIKDGESDLYKAMKLISKTKRSNRSNSKYGLQY